ncbi:Crp/Fnr family transcriptional regulator [Runella zeae]|uniref:Crp/Fnr family transcriptional regulator n=1 Tax=Runella zeae TaxID=94255 RepID=UPI0003F63E07|nr:Crp/Fnr family transcriptional regulator [Runella zeae]
MDFSLLKTFINQKVAISDLEFEQLAHLVYLKKFKKNEIILNQGEVCHFIGFINQGLIRSYYYDEGGKEITTKFFFENCLFTYVEGFIENSASNKTFVALENCETLMIKKSTLWGLFEIQPKFEKIFSFILMEDLKNMIQAEEEKRNETPQARYLNFKRLFPTAANRIALKYLASYLGIEPQSLSRIRKRLTAQSRK